MTFSAWKRILVAVLAFEVAFAPSLALAKGPYPKNIGQPYFPTSEDYVGNAMFDRLTNIDALIERDQLPQYSEDDYDPWQAVGQYVRLFGRPNKKDPNAQGVTTDGRVIDQYFLDEPALDRKIPRYTKLTPTIELDANNRRCLVLKATKGEDESGQGGRTVAKLYVPKMCGIAALTYDKEVLTIVHDDGSYSLADWGYVTAQAFRARIWFKKVQPFENLNVDFANAGIVATPITLGMKPPNLENTYENAVVPRVKDAAGNWVENFVAGDVLVQDRNGKYVAVLNHNVSRRLLLLEQVKLLEAYAVMKGKRNHIDAFKSAVKFLESRYQNQSYADIMKGTNPTDTEDLAVAAMFAELGPRQASSLMQSVEAFQRYSTRDNDSFTLGQWADGFREIEKNAEILNGLQRDKKKKAAWENLTPEQKQENLRTRWRYYYASDRQTIEQRAEVMNPRARDTNLEMIKQYRFTGVLLAGLGGLMAFPFAVEKSEWLQRVGFVNWLYKQLPEVLKLEHAAYRTPLIQGTVFLSLLTFVPDVMSMTAAFTFQTLGKVAHGREGEFWDKVRDMSQFWGDQKRWQRIVTAGAQFGIKFAVSPIFKIAQLMGQEAAIASLSKFDNPARKIKAAEPLGQSLGLEQDRMIGLTEPTWGSVKNRIKNFVPGVNTDNGDLANRVRERAQQRLQAEDDAIHQRKREYARLLATIVVASRHGVLKEDIYLMMKHKGFVDSKIDQNDLVKILGHEMQDERRLVEEMTVGQLKSFPRDFKFTPAFKSIPDGEMAGFVREAEDYALKLKNLDGYKRHAEIQKLAMRERSVQLWSESLNQGRRMAEFIEGRVANEDVYINFQGALIPDHIMVGIIPNLVNIPYVASRADFNHPDQLAADANTWTKVSNVHGQDVYFNLGVHGLMASAQDMAQFMRPQPHEEDNYLSRFRQRNLVLRRLDGMEEWGVPSLKKMPTDRHEGYIEQQPVGQAFKSWVHQVRYVDLGEQARNTMSTMYNSLWIYVFLQLAMRMGPGHQSFEMAMLGLTFAFQASPVFYKWAWWFVKPANNNYMNGRKAELNNFSVSLSDLQRAKAEPVPEKRRALMDAAVAVLKKQYSGVATIDPPKRKRYGDYKTAAEREAEKPKPPEAVVETTVPVVNLSVDPKHADTNFEGVPTTEDVTKLETKQIDEKNNFWATEVGQAWAKARPELVAAEGEYDLETVAQAYIDLATSKSPLGLAPNPFVPSFINGQGAIWSTFFAIPMLVLATSAHFLTPANVGLMTAASLGIQGLAIAYFSDTSVRRFTAEQLGHGIRKVTAIPKAAARTVKEAAQACTRALTSIGKR